MMIYNVSSRVTEVELPSILCIVHIPQFYGRCRPYIKQILVKHHAVNTDFFTRFHLNSICGDYNPSIYHNNALSFVTNGIKNDIIDIISWGEGVVIKSLVFYEMGKRCLTVWPVLSLLMTLLDKVAHGYDKVWVLFMHGTGLLGQYFVIWPGVLKSF